MATDLSRPGVYLEEGNFVDSTSSSPTSSTALFLGIAPKGSITAPVRCESWSEYVANFGGFDPVTDNLSVSYKSYLPYAVYSYFQNGGRPCYVQRVVNSATPGVSAFKNVSGTKTEVIGVTAATTTISVASATGIVVGGTLQIESEKLGVTAISSNTLTVTRAQSSTTAAIHANSVPVALIASTTLGAAIANTSVTSITVTSANNIVIGSVLTIGTEDMVVTGVSGTTLTVTRGSSPATASNGAAVASIKSALTTLSGNTGTAIVTGTSFTLTAKTPGTDGNGIGYTISSVPSTVNGVSKPFFTINIYYSPNVNETTLVETFFNMTLDGASGTSRLDNTINDPYTGSKYVSLSAFDPTRDLTITTSIQTLSGGTNPALSVSGSTGSYTADYASTTAGAVTAATAISAITGPVLLNLTSFETTGVTPQYYTPNTNTVSTVTSIKDRGNVFIINDSIPARASTAVDSYLTTYITNTGTNGLNSSGTAGDSYMASYAPWIIIPDPSPSGSTITIPPGGAVAGVIARTDSTNGVFRAPAGIIASITNAVGVETKFTDVQLGTINSANVNVIRPVTGAGIAVMGARTRKIYGPDKYVSGRRTLIYIKERLRQSTQFAIFENNDQKLWLSLISAAEQILRPLWEQGGLKGNNPQEAYYIKCDSSINIPALVQAGEVRMDVGIALQYPAEFIVIRVTQYENGGYTAEVNSSN